MALSEENPVYGPFFGVMGAAAAIIFSGKPEFLLSPTRLIVSINPVDCLFVPTVYHQENYCSIKKHLLIWRFVWFYIKGFSFGRTKI